MTDPALKEAYQRVNHALTCDQKEQYQEAYRNYLATTTYITNILGLRSSGAVWCDSKSQKLLEMAQMCIEAAARISKRMLDGKTDPKEIIPSTSQQPILDLPSQGQPRDHLTSPRDQLTSPPPSSPHDHPLSPEPDDPDDLLSILDSLPDIPANKPGKKYQRSATLPNLGGRSPEKGSATLPNLGKVGDVSPEKPAVPPPNPRASSTLGRNLYSSNHMSHILTSQYGTSSLAYPHGSVSNMKMNNEPVLKVSPVDRAKEQNAILAAQYERKAAKGLLQPRDRLSLIRAQEENLSIARELERNLARKCEQRKLRLEQEEIPTGNVEKGIGTFEAVLYGRESLMRGLVTNVKEFDTQSGKLWPTGEESLMTSPVLDSILSWSFSERSHPICKLVGEAQFNFYNRLSPLNKKMFIASTEERASLMPGVIAEIEAISADITMFLQNISIVLTSAYPLFRSEEGYNLLQDRLSDMFFRPFLKLLLEVYSFIRQEDIKLFKSYLGNHSHENISLHSEIKPKYRLEAEVDPYSRAIETLREIVETGSPLRKLDLLETVGVLITTAVQQYYIGQGMGEEEATDISYMGADDMLPITIYIISRANRADLLTQLQFLFDTTPDGDLMGSKGYCLTTVQYAIEYIVRKERECPDSSFPLHSSDRVITSGSRIEVGRLPNMDTGLLQDDQLQPLSTETGISGASLSDVPAVQSNVGEASSYEHRISQPGISAQNLDIDDLMPELGKYSPIPLDKH